MHCCYWGVLRGGLGYMLPGMTSSHVAGLTPVLKYSSQQGMFCVASLMELISALTMSFFMATGGSPRCLGGGLPAYVRLSKRQAPNLPATHHDRALHRRSQHTNRMSCPGRLGVCLPGLPACSTMIAAHTAEVQTN